MLALPSLFSQGAHDLKEMGAWVLDQQARPHCEKD
jgi:hypothetical protein